MTELRTFELSARERDVMTMGLVYGIAAIQSRPRDFQDNADLRVMSVLARINRAYEMPGMIAAVEQKLGREIDLWSDCEAAEMSPDDIEKRDALREKIAKLNRKAEKFSKPDGSGIEAASLSRGGGLPA